MTPLKPEQKESILTRLAFLEAELDDLEKLGTITWQIYNEVRDKRLNVERMVENLTNACIDIGKIILAGEAAEMPATYKEVFHKLSWLEIIPVSLADELVGLVELRNALAHQYLDLKWDKIKSFLQDGPRVIKSFAALVQKITL
jgi:uncharacterized protein YutE (UPF0331/DUF86 family)